MESFDPTLFPDRVTAVLSRLRAALPVSLPLYRRIQFAHFTPTSRITTSLPTTPSDPWLITFSDPDRGPETQLFLHGSWESVHSDLPPSDPRIRALLAKLIAHLRSEALFSPQRRTELVRAALEARGVDLASDTRHLILCGSVHAATARLLRSIDVLDPNFPRASEDREAMPERYNKWVFDLRGATAEEEVVLPEGLRWGRLRTEDYELVRSRTWIKRKDRTLSMLPDVGVIPTGETSPVAWTFLGVDSSITTLHVEPEYRGMGLAKAVVRKAWRDHLDYYMGSNGGIAPQERWAHADVATDNVSSNAVCKSLGGEVMWADYWLTMDLTRFNEVVA